MYSADLNGDGLADLYFTYGNFVVLLNNGNGTFRSTAYPVGGWPQYIPVDLKGTGKPDLFGADNNGYAPFRTFIQVPNNGNGTFGLFKQIPSGTGWYPPPPPAGRLNRA